MTALATLTDGAVAARPERAMQSAARTGTGAKARRGRTVAEQAAAELSVEMGTSKRRPMDRVA